MILIFVTTLIQDYFDKLICKRQCRGIKVNQNGEFGKGEFTVPSFAIECHDIVLCGFSFGNSGEEICKVSTAFVCYEDFVALDFF